MELASNLEFGHPRRQAALDRLVGDLWRKGKYADAQELRRNELAATELKLTPGHPAIATALRGLAAVLGGSAQHDEALKLYQRALAIDERAFGFQSDQASADHFASGLVLRNLGQFEEARAETRAAQEGWNSIDRILSGSVALEQLALLSLDQNALAEGVVLMERRLGIAEEVLGADSPALIPVVATLGRVYLVSGQLDLARQCLARSEALAGSDLRPDGPNYLIILQLRAFISAQSGDVVAAERQLKEALEIIAKRENGKAFAFGSNLANLATVYLNANRLRDAIATYAEALDIFRRESGPRSPIVGHSLALASLAYSRAGDQATAKTLLDAAVEILGPALLAQQGKQRWL
jgi:tetratricopeptide (TPR) repeat protein